MAKRSLFCSRPFKIVVVGESRSGKSTLIQKFLSGFREEQQKEGDENICKPTYVCDSHSVLLKSTVKHVRKDGSSVALSNEDIARRLWVKKFSKSLSFPRSIVLKPEDQQDLIWDEIFVYLHKVRQKKDSNPSLTSLKKVKCGVASTADCSESIPGNHVRSFLQARASETSRVSSDAKTGVTEVEVDLWDTAGDRSLMWYRWYACTGADAVLLCVPLSSILSFERSRINGNADGGAGDESKIADELQKYLSDEFLSNRTKKVDYRVPPVLLVGTKSDQCDIRVGIDTEEENVVDAVGINLAAEIGCCDFVSCSGLRGSGVTSVFEAALAISLTSDGKYRASTIKRNSESEHSDAETSLAREVAQPTYFKVHSFQKPSRPDLYESNCSLKVESRSPPEITFPPPPDFSPPSTLPPSSSSFERSSSSSSLNSGADLNNGEGCTILARSFDEGPGVPRIDTRASVEYDSDNGVMVKTTPIPVRRKHHPSPTQCRSAASNAFSSFPATPPVPKPRRISASPNSRRKMNREKRRETIFIKFLQT